MDTAGRHPGTAHVARYFAYDHLPAHLQVVSKPSGLRKVLEAKDCCVRAAVDAERAA